MDAAGIEAWISGREKTPYSIWRKMQRKNISFEQLSDIMAFRIVVADVTDCYQALGVLHSTYPMVPGRFKDYITTPKPNGYRSLHTSVIGPERQRIEVQIRTREMHDVAELGVAAHWRYKQDAPAARRPASTAGCASCSTSWSMRPGPEEFLEHTKLEMFQDQVFCFTPKGDLIALPRGATPVDFAYAVHTQVGDTLRRRQDQRPHDAAAHPARRTATRWRSSPRATQTPSPTWERFVVTGKARACIRRFIRTQQRAQYLELGRSILAQGLPP